MNRKIHSGDKVRVDELAPEHAGKEGDIVGIPTYLSKNECLCRVRDADGKEFTISDEFLTVLE